MSRIGSAVAGMACIVLLALAWTAHGQEAANTRTVNSPEPEKRQIYTCPMHPEIQWTRADKCPICDMKLVAKGSATQDSMQSHAHMDMGRETMQHHHGGMMMPGCSMCMEMLGMSHMNSHRSNGSTRAVRSMPPSYRVYGSPGGHARGCGC